LRNTHFDILIIGAGLSGIGSACRLSREFPEKSIAILERRKSAGGTWDLFRYPGIRSDSDVCTYGYEFRPWNKPEILADGPAIRDYINDTADEFGIRDKIRFGMTVVAADWNSEQQAWHVHCVDSDTSEAQNFSCRFLIACSGYYNYDQGYIPEFPGIDEYQGQLIHPQHWPEDLDYSGKKVLVIGSGATAITLVPAMAEEAGHVTMLQRSPSYIYSIPAYDSVAAALYRVFPTERVFRFIRKRNILMQRGLFKAARRWPGLMRRFLLWRVRKHVGPDIDMRHFTPKYAPWDERLCVVPDADLFRALRNGDASIVTDQVRSFTKNGILLESGEEFEADIVISATGFKLQVLGGTKLTVDGEAYSLGQLMTYKGLLIQDIPNFATVYGYVNLTWTLKVDLSATYLCRLFRYMDDTGNTVVVPRDDGDHATATSVMDRLNAGYVKRGGACLPRQGNEAPWEVAHDYRLDREALVEDPIEDTALTFLSGQH